MNSTQLNSTLAGVVGVIAGFLAGRGVFGFDQSTWVTIITAIAGFGATLWTIWSTRKSAIVTTTANLPEVKEVTLTRGVTGTSSLDDATPNNVVVK